MQINLCFLWHMHQPDYTDNKGELYMPWVFLHSIRDYYDMLYMVSKFPNLKATFNLTPTLIRQILIYEKYGYEKDNFLKLLVKENNELNDEERSYILKICKSLQPKMIEQFFRLEEIIDKDRISNQEFIDLEVLFLLAWTGNYLRVNNEIIKNLIIKEKFFTEEDKLLLVNELVKFIPKILPFYKSLLEKKQISVSTTPYYHPILPLLLDMKNAVKSNEKTVITDNYFSLKDDALKHIDMSINLYEEIFEVKPSGFWPAEGAVDEESIKIYKDKGIKWIATDELILFKSLGDFDKKKLYDLYEFNDVFIGFRDRHLSDLIGFQYQNYNEKKAVEDFTAKLQLNDKDNPNIFIILDGENAWDFYKNNAYDFFMSLYENLSINEEIKTFTFDEISELKTNKLNKISPGSWINGNFDTWAGHSEKNRAWFLIFKTKLAISKIIDSLNEEQKEKINEHFLAAECSDWFWWYGDDHKTDFALEFDSLFRSHLIDIYSIANLSVDDELFEPIYTAKENNSMSESIGELSICLNGKIDSFFEWQNSGEIDLTSFYSTMDSKRSIFKKVYFGADTDFLYIRIDCETEKLFENYKFMILDFKNLKKKIKVPISKKYSYGKVKLAINEIIEISISKELLQNKEKIFLQLEFIDKNNEIEFLPLYGEIKINLNYDKFWFL